ncbi:MAG TPA: hypothetical protein VFG39_02100 [Balneolaceae bacterium]|nr:hypothetical protein [Balneolaceae bacterium]
MKVTGILILIVFIIFLEGCKSGTPDKNNKNEPYFFDKQSRLSITYSPHLKLTHKSVADTVGWSYLSQKPGYLAAQFRLSQSFQPKTNFSEATVTLGWSDNPQQTQSCFKLPSRYIFEADTIQKDGESFRYVRFGEAGAGNFYLITQYRARKWNRCYSIESVVHSTNIHNYPSKSGITEFDSLKVHKVLQSVIEGLTFISEKSS